MPEAKVIDISVAQLTSADIKSAGAIGVVQYLSLPGTRPGFNEAKRIKKPVYDDRLAWGLAVALVFQVDKADYLGGYARGFEFGRASREQSTALGHPDSAGVILCVQDSGIPRGSFGLAVEHMRGYVDGRGLGPQPAYCGTDLGNYLVGAGLTTWLWQPAAASWSTSPSPHVSMQQLESKSYPWPQGAYDENLVLQPDWGQNPRPGLPPPPPGGPNLLEDEMLWARFYGENQDVAFGATGWRYITPEQRDQLLFMKLLRPMAGTTFPQVLGNNPAEGAQWKARYAQFG